MMYVRKLDQRRSYRANGIFLVMLATLVGSLPYWGADWFKSHGIALMGFEGKAVCLGLMSLLFAWGSGLMAKSKGYSGLWGLLSLPLLTWPGFLLVLLLPDKWHPKHELWVVEATDHLVDGEYYSYTYEAHGKLASLCLRRFVWAGVFFAMFPAAVLLTADLSSFTQAAWRGLGLWAMVPAAAMLILGSGCLARIKNYDPLLAAIGLALVPVFGLSALIGKMPLSHGISLLMICVFTGPVFLLLAPSLRPRLKKSPFEVAPQKLYLPNPEFH